MAISLSCLLRGKSTLFSDFLPSPRSFAPRNIGRPILNTATDKPWALYLCRVIYSNRDFVRANPIATKRALRAILKATDMCAIEPEQAARRLVDAGGGRRATRTRSRR